MNQGPPLPTVSIVTTTFNSILYLQRTIESVLGQEYPSIDYVIVDGGSTDGTLDVIRKHSGAGIRWISEPDRGISDAFNKGIAMARGDIVGIVSSDDWLAPGAIRRVVEGFALHPSAHIVHGNMVSVEQEGRRQYLVRPDTDLRFIHRRQPLKHAATFITKAAYEHWGGYSLRYRYAMDYELVLRFYVGGAVFAYIDAVLAYVRPGGTSYRWLYRTMNDTRLISLEYGLSPLHADAIFVRKLIRVYLRAMLLRPQFAPLLRLYRRANPRFAAVPGSASANQGLN